MLKLIAIDDERAILDAIKRLLRKEKIDVIGFNDPVEAIKFAQDNPVHIVISDIRMPTMNGIEAMHKLHKSDPLSSKILITGYSDKDPIIDAINSGVVDFYIEKPWQEKEFISTIRKAAKLVSSEIENQCLNEQIQAQSKELFRANQKLEELNGNLEEKISERTKELQNSYLATINTFSRIISKRLHQTDLNRNIAVICDGVATKIGLPHKERQSLGFAAQLHDLGKIALDDELIQQAYEELNPDQKKAFERHPIHAQTSLSMIPVLKQAGDIIANHKEQPNGEGYPRKLSDNEILMAGHILHVVTEYFDLINGRLLTTKLSHSHAVQYIQENIGIRFNKQTTDAFLEIITRVQLGDSTQQKELNITALTPGMRLAKDLYSSHKVLLLVEGTILDKANISHLKNLESNNIDPLTVTVNIS